MKYLVPLSLLLSMLPEACARRAGNMGPSAHFSSVSIAKFEPLSGKPAWETMKVSIQTVARGEPVVKEVRAGDFASGDVKDATIKIPYGDYRIAISFADTQQKVIYTECADEKTKRHKIDKPIYLARIEICSTANDEPSGTVDIVDMTELTIVPVARTPTISMTATVTCEAAQKSFKAVVMGDKNPLTLYVAGSCTPSMSCDAETLTAAAVDPLATGTGARSGKIVLSSAEHCLKAKSAIEHEIAAAAR